MIVCSEKYGSRLLTVGCYLVDRFDNILDDPILQSDRFTALLLEIHLGILHHTSSLH